MNRVSEEELKRITEEKGFEYVGVNYTTGKTHNTNIVFKFSRQMLSQGAIELGSDLKNIILI